MKVEGTGVCQAIWGNTSGTRGISFEVLVDPKNTGTCSYFDTGLTVRYTLSDMTEYSKVSEAAKVRDRKEKANALAGHKF